jgi:hypothetical protein
MSETVKDNKLNDDDPIATKQPRNVDDASSYGPIINLPQNKKPIYLHVVPFLLLPIMIIISPYFIYLMLFNEGIKDVIRKVRTKKSVRDNDIYKDKELIKNLWESTIGKLYFNAVEYQTAEGKYKLLIVLIIILIIILVIISTY